ncbi:MAG: efflux RND transporter periplasmic adaptor subunit [Alphaproteobacteria bacterium]|nr:efflux RND transporter periplasmic adaptor subunit [Alphaproteobacteria bacterium]
MDVEAKPGELKQAEGPVAKARAAYSKVADGPIGKRVKGLAPKTQRTRLIAVAVLIVLLAGLGYWFWGGSSSSSEALIVTVEKADVEDSVTALGNLQPRDYVDVGAQVSGQLDTLHVDVGATVKKGDLLAEIDPQLQAAKVAADQAQLKNLRAQQADRQAQLDLARGQYSRQKMLKAANATSEDAYQSSLSSMQSAVVGVNSIKAQIEQTTSTLKGDQVTLGYTKIYAPMAGTVVSVTAKQGQTLNANQSAPVILRVADLSTMTVWTQVSEADVPKLKTGMAAYFTILGSPRKRWEGKLRQILPTPENVNNVVLYTALFDVDNKDGDLMTQMTAQVFFVISGAKDAISVPIAALKRFKPRQKLYKATVVTESGRQEEREVQVGVTNRVSAQVLSGLNVGDRVIAGTKTETSSSGQQRDRTGGSGRRGSQGGGGFRGFP